MHSAKKYKVSLYIIQGDCQFLGSKAVPWKEYLRLYLWQSGRRMWLFSRFNLVPSTGS
jgi:hypothetical protein